MIAGFYTYIHRRADDGKVFYVGKGRGKRAWSRYRRNQYWLRTEARHGLHVEIVAHWSTEREAFDHEKLLIALYRAANHPLSNLTDGGDGPSGYRHTDETRALFRARKISDEHRAKVSAANRGLIRSDEFRAKVSAGLTGRPVSAETRAKLSAAHKGVSPTKEVREKIASTLSGRRLSDAEKDRRRPLTHSAQWRAKHSAAMKGRPWSAARRAAYEQGERKF